MFLAVNLIWRETHILLIPRLSEKERAASLHNIATHDHKQTLRDLQVEDSGSNSGRVCVLKDGG